MIEEIKHYLSITASLLKEGNFKTINGYYNLDDFVLKNGIPFISQKLPKGYKRGIVKECYTNAYRLAIDEDLVYVEGYAYSGLIPVLHAWCLDKDDKVIDPTWENPEDCGYFGIPIDEKYLIGTVMAKGTYGVIDNWKDRWPMLTEDPEEWLHSDYKGVESE